MKRIQRWRPSGWKQNALRHSYASYRLAVMEDVSKLALELAARGVEFVETMAVRSLQRELRELSQVP